MRKVLIFVAVFLSLLASSAFAVDTELFTTMAPSAVQAEGMIVAFGKYIRVGEPVQFNPELLLRPQQNVGGFKWKAEANSIQEVGSFASEVNFQVEGIFYKAVLHHGENHGEGNYSWFGYVAGSQFPSHFAVVNYTTATGDIWLPTFAPGGMHRSILPRGGQHFLVQWDEEAIGRGLANDQATVHIDNEIEIQSASIARTVRRHLEPASCRSGVVAQQLNLVVVYDTTALSVAGGLASLLADIQVEVDRANATIVNSKVGGNYHVNLVAVMPVDYTSAVVTGGDLSDDLGWAGSSKAVASLKAKYNAQLVSLWVGYPESGDGAIGIAAMPGNDDDSLAYSVVVVGTGNEVLCHEVGHNLGMSHQWQIVPTPWAQYAADNAVDGHWRGAVSTGVGIDTACPHGCSEVIPVFPNPKVFVDGVSTGISGVAENWRMVGVGFPMLGATPTCVAQ